MEGVIKKAAGTFGRKSDKNEIEVNAEEQLLTEIREVCRLIDNAYNRFEFEEDTDLIESNIYEIQSLKARYRYLLRVAKEHNITSPVTMSPKVTKREDDFMG